MVGQMKILAGNSNGPIAEAIAAYLGEPLTRCHVRRFADMEIFVEILENVRGRDAFIIQSTSYPANDNLMELLIMIDALRRAEQIIGRNVEKPLDLAGVQVDGQHAVGAGAGDEIGDQLGRNRRARAGLAVLPGIAEIGDDGGDAPRR